MKKNKIFVLAAATLVLGGFALLKSQNMVKNHWANDEIQQRKNKKILYFNPSIYPDVEEIKKPTYAAFFTEVTDQISNSKNTFLKADQIIDYDDVSTAIIKEYCLNNEADFAIVPKVKYFKVGLGKYVFSSQVVVSMKLYNSEGQLISESQYDTYKKNKRLLGSAENFIKLGTRGALKDVLKTIKTQKTLPITTS